jgi:anaerobic ribonucleoside-triphosphate reductase activating protein
MIEIIGDNIMISVYGRVQDSIVDGPGLRYVLFVQGCNHHCKGCHNPETWEFNNSKLMTAEAVIAEISGNPLVTGVTFSGGEPVEQADELLPVLEWCKANNYDTMMYTGYTYDQIKDLPILNYVDYLVDGEFIEEQKSLLLKFRGSKNQRIIDIKQTRDSGQVIEVDYDNF